MKKCICGHLKSRHITNHQQYDNMNPCLDCDCLDFEKEGEMNETEN